MVVTSKEKNSMTFLRERVQSFDRLAREWSTENMNLNEDLKGVPRYWY